MLQCAMYVIMYLGRFNIMSICLPSVCNHTLTALFMLVLNGALHLLRCVNWLAHLSQGRSYADLPSNVQLLFVAPALGEFAFCEPCCCSECGFTCSREVSFDFY